ncbi:MAG: choice-of-anchor D domain-containing protein [Luteitalea sp.]|nr:choice-of-anchor D domain-containing protein [Luteitalea sp.]
MLMALRRRSTFRPGAGVLPKGLASRRPVCISRRNGRKNMVERANGIEFGRRGVSRRRSLCGALRILAALLIVAAPWVDATPALAQESPTHIYWANADAETIGRANLDGTEPDQDFIIGASRPDGVAVDADHIYWANFAADTIGRANLDGSDPDQSFITGAASPVGVAVDADYVYWGNWSGDTIGRANLDGSDPDQGFITGARTPSGVAVDGEHIYWANYAGDTIGRANLDGSDPNQSFIIGAQVPDGVAVDADHIYWTNFVADTIGRANLDGSDPDQSFITGAASPVGVAVDADYVYWGNLGGSTIGRANLDGSDPNQSFITGASGAKGVAVGPGADPPSPEAGIAPEVIEFGAVITGEASGTEMVTVTNVGGGTLTVDAAALAGDHPGQFTIAGDGCEGAQLGASETCDIDLEFTPASAGGKTATLEVPHNGPESPATVALSGEGTLPPTWTISGTIQDASGAPLPDVPVGLTGTSDAGTTTTAQGTYTFANLAEGGSYTVMPSLDGYTFTPASQEFGELTGDATADFTAAAVEVSITGTVVDEDDQPLEGVTVTLSGNGHDEVTTAADGAFAFEGLTWGDSYTVTPTHPDYDVQPPSQTFDPLETDQEITFTATRLTAVYTRYFGEGAIGEFFDTTFALFNPTDEEASATLTFAGETGQAVHHPVTIPAGQQVIVNPETLLPEEWVGFATAIEADQTLVTSRTMAWDERHYGRHESAGVATPQTEWWFTEGATGTFQLFYLLYNPGDDAAQVTATYYRGAEQAAVTRTYTVGPHTRRTVFVNVGADGVTPDPELGATEVSAHIVATNGVPIVAERALYLTTNAAQPLTAGTIAPGVTAPATSWHFAEGATDFFDLFLLLANPSTERVDATVRYLLPTGEPIERTYPLEPESRGTVWVDAEDAALAETQVAITVQSDTPILAERAMWWGATGAWDGGHVSTGATRPATRWGLAGLTLGGPDTAEAYVLIANPNAVDAEATLTLVTPDGTREPVVVPLGPWSRTTLRLVELFPDAGAAPVAVHVESTGGENPVPLVVEGAAYASPDDQPLTTGSATPALPLPE